MTLNSWQIVGLTDDVATLVEDININSNSGKTVDEVSRYTISTGIFRTGNELVNSLAIGPHYNLQLSSSQISAVQFTGFKFYFKSLHKIFEEQIVVDLSSYNDDKTHILYLKPDLTTIVLDTLYDGVEDYLRLARFVIKSSNNEPAYFFIYTRNAGTNSFDKNGIKYEVLDGLEVDSLELLKLKVSNGHIKYSGINTLSDTEADILTEEFTEGNYIPIRYITSGTEFNEVNWISSAVDSITTNKVISYSTGALSDVPAGKFVCQKLYYDYMTKTAVIQYGSVIYDTKTEAMSGASNFTYSDPDFTGAYIPLAVMIIKSGESDLTTSTDFTVINITDNSSFSSGTATDPVAQETANSALSQAQAAQTDATKAIGDAAAAQTTANTGVTNAASAQTTADTANTSITNHLADTNNPHGTTKALVGLANVDNTSDASKPLSTPQKTYVDEKVTTLQGNIDLKQDISSAVKVYVINTGDALPTGLKAGDIVAYR